jgi:hypothetical protein
MVLEERIYTEFMAWVDQQPPEVQPSLPSKSTLRLLAQIRQVTFFTQRSPVIGCRPKTVPDLLNIEGLQPEQLARHGKKMLSILLSCCAKMSQALSSSSLAAVQPSSPSSPVELLL